MHHELSDIKRLRKQQGLTQQELAKLSGVSQSLIAKIEAGMLDPTFTRAKKIFDVLENISAEKEAKAEDIMVTKIFKLQKDQILKNAIKKMKEYGISQLPVLDGDAVVGMVSEGEIINQVLEGGDPSRMKVSDVMQESPPVVSARTPLHLLMDLLRFSSLIVIADSGKIKGVVTKADIIKAISKS